jgi:hypothetical protein
VLVVQRCRRVQCVLPRGRCCAKVSPETLSCRP